jgi:hypothetical protein
MEVVNLPTARALAVPVLNQNQDDENHEKHENARKKQRRRESFLSRFSRPFVVHPADGQR